MSRLEGSNEPELHLKIGFIGLGNIGCGIVKKLVYSGYKVTVWNRSAQKLYDFQDDGVNVGRTPADVVAVSDVTFSCVADSTAAREVVFGNYGVLKEIREGKGYVEMTSIDPDTSEDIAEAIYNRGGQYLEAPVCGSEELSKKGKLIIFASGDKELFDKCKSCFTAIGDNEFFLGDVGNANKMHLILSMLMNVSLASLTETMYLAKYLNVSEPSLLDVLKSEPLNCPLFVNNAKAIINECPSDMPLKHIQKDLQTVLKLGKQHMQPLPTTTAASEMYKIAMNLGAGRHGISALCKALYDMKPPMHAIL